jgi:hypothetical protein
MGIDRRQFVSGLDYFRRHYQSAESITRHRSRWARRVRQVQPNLPRRDPDHAYIAAELEKLQMRDQAREDWEFLQREFFDDFEELDD